MILRRHFLLYSAAASAVGLARPAFSQQTGALQRQFAALERSSGGRLGVCVLNTGNGHRIGHRADERFPMCSTFKFLLAAAVLARVDREQEQLSRMLPIPPKPLLGNSPLTEPHAGGRMDVAALCQAALTRSDNTAANVLLETVHGPAGLTSFMRSVGDRVTRLDRTEPLLNESRPGDPRDTTSPTAMAEDLQRILLGDVLRPASRDRLRLWMMANQTGDARLRARLPNGWIAADKTGSDGATTSNDIAVLWPPKGAPLIVSAYLTECAGPEDKRSGVLADVGRAVFAHSANI